MFLLHYLLYYDFIPFQFPNYTAFSQTQWSPPSKFIWIDLWLLLALCHSTTQFDLCGPPHNSFLTLSFLNIPTLKYFLGKGCFSASLLPHLLYLLLLSGFASFLISFPNGYFSWSKLTILKTMNSVKTGALTLNIAKCPQVNKWLRPTDVSTCAF